MSTGIEPIKVIEPWLYKVLSGDTVIAAAVNDRVVNTLAAAGVDSPYVFFDQATTRDRRLSTGVRIWNESIYQVKLVMATASWVPMLPIAERIDLLLDRPNEVIETEHGVLECVRERTVEYPEMVQGIQYRHLGGQYKIKAYVA